MSRRNTYAKRNDGRDMHHWSVWVAEWAVYLSAAGRSPGTIRLRRYWVSRLAESVEAGPAVVAGDDVAAWLASDEWSANTRCSARASVRAFFAWVRSTGRRGDDPTAALLAIAPTPGRPRPCPESALLVAVRRAGDRERLMLALGACAGRPPERRPRGRTGVRATTGRLDHAHAAAPVRERGVPGPIATFERCRNC